MKKTITMLLVFTLCISLCACGAAPAETPTASAADSSAPTEAPAAAEEVPVAPATISFTDDCGRVVELPAEITRIAPSGTVANMFLAAAAPEYMVSISDNYSEEQCAYLGAELSALPVTGSLYGGKGDANLEAILAAAPQLIIDMGDKRGDTADSLDALQAQIGVPCVFIAADLPNMADAFRTLGALLADKAGRCAELAGYVEETVSLAEETAAKIPESERVRVMYTTGTDGLGTNARGSTQAQVIELIGGVNAIETAEVVHKSGGNIINMEQLYLFDPDVIIFTQGSIYDTVASETAWQKLAAVSDGRYYEVPSVPYNWLSLPPSMNMILGIRWLGNLLYPDYYDFDMVAETQRAYRTLWDYDMSAAEAEALLSRSTLK